VTGSIAGSWVGRFDDSSVPTGRVQLGGYLLIDTSVTYRWREPRLTVAVDNLLDRDFQQFVGFPGRGRRLRLELPRRSDWTREATG
jgi:outer membrane cobalamin receptor